MDNKVISTNKRKIRTQSVKIALNRNQYQLIDKRGFIGYFSIFNCDGKSIVVPPTHVHADVCHRSLKFIDQQLIYLSIKMKKIVYSSVV